MSQNKKDYKPHQHKNGDKFIPKKELLKEVLSQGQGENPCLKCFFCTSSKGFYAFFDDKDSVVCIKTEPFKARFCGFFATACALQPARSPFYKRLKMTKVRRHCEQILQKFAWQSINLKYILNFFGFFANAQNDKFFVVLSCHTERSEVSINLRRILKFLWIFRFLTKAQNDKIF